MSRVTPNAVDRLYRAGLEHDFTSERTKLVVSLTGIAGSLGITAGMVGLLDPLIGLSTLAVEVIARLGVRGHNAHRAKQLRQSETIDLRELRSQPDGTLVHVRGRVQAKESLEAFFDHRQGVFRRLRFRPDVSWKVSAWWIHETSCDFALVDEQGRRVLVRAADARLLASMSEPTARPTAMLLHDRVPPAVADLVRKHDRPNIFAAEVIVADGAQVDVVGVKTTIPDATGDASGYREPPQLAALESGNDTPLVLIPG